MRCVCERGGVDGEGTVWTYLLLQLRLDEGKSLAQLRAFLVYHPFRKDQLFVLHRKDQPFVLPLTREVLYGQVRLSLAFPCLVQ